MSSPSRVELKLDWCSHDAAKFACEHWHYSRCVPMPPIVRIGVWEDSKFVGVVLFNRGACMNLGKPFGLSQTQVCELVRIALRQHATPVSRIIRIALRMLKKSQPGLRLVVSFADPHEGHHGGVYQASGWVFAGATKPERKYMVDGRIVHRRVYEGKQFGNAAPQLPANAKPYVAEPKYRYLMPLDDGMREFVSKLSKPYPKRQSAHPRVAGPSVPTTEGVRPDRCALAE